MSGKEDRYTRIREFLQDRYPEAVSISTISRSLNMNRGSVAKYLDVLQSHGHVVMKPFGKAKLYSSAQTVPFDDLFDYLSDAIVILDADLHILMVNRSFIETFNIRSERNMLGSELSRINLALFNNPTIWDNIDRILNSQTFINEMLLIERGTERVFLTEFISAVMPSISFTGKPGIMITLRDITLWKKTEEALKNSERKIRTLFEEVPSGICLFQEDGTILNANRASLDILGLTRFTDLADFKLYDIMCSRDIVQDLIRKGKIAELTLSCNFDRLKSETLTTTKKSGVAYFQVVFAPVTDKGGKAPREFFILFLDITAKKIAEKQLKERYQGIMSNLPGIIYQYYARDSGEWGVYYVNERSQEIYGVTTEPLETWFARYGACIAPEDQERWFDSINDVIRRIVPWEFEGRFIKPSGEEMYIRGVSHPVRLKNETVWNGIFLDITDRKKAEEALRMSEERFRGITSNLPGIVYQFYVHDSGKRGMYYVDDRSTEVYGLSPDPLATWIQRYGSCIAPEDRERWIKSMRDAIQRVAPWEFEGRFIKPTGEEMFIRVLSQPVRLRNETVWNGIFLDITDRKKAEEALRMSEERFRGITSNLPGIVYQFYVRDSGKRGMYYVDDRSTEVYGLSPDPLDTWLERYGSCIAPEDRECWAKSMRNAIERVAPWEFEGRFIKPTGEEMFIRVLSQPVRLRNETVWNGIFLDITDRKKAEEALRMSEERFRGITSNLPGIVYQFYVCDSGKRGMYYVDDRSTEVYGLSPDPLATWIQRYGSCIAPEDRERWVKSMEDAIERVAPWEFEGRFIKPTGEEMFIRVISQPVRQRNETVWDGIILDVTDRMRAEEALRRTELKEIRYHSFFENACNGVLIYEPIGQGEDYIIKDVNRVTAALMRMNKEDIVGKKLFEEFPDLPNPYVPDLLYRVLTTENPEFVTPLKYRNRDDFPWISHYVFKLPSGEIASFMIDVTEVMTEDTYPEREGGTN